MSNEMKAAIFLIIIFTSCATQTDIIYGKEITKYNSEGKVISVKHIPPTKRQKRNNYRIDPMWNKIGLPVSKTIEAEHQWARCRCIRPEYKCLICGKEAETAKDTLP